MERIFGDTLTRRNTDVSGLNKYLKVGDIDFDNIDVDGDIKFRLKPDDRNYGLDGIDVEVVKIGATITWQVDSEYESLENVAKLIAAGGSLLRNGMIEGQVEIVVTPDDKGWQIDTKGVEFKPSGAVGITNVEFEFGDTGINFITVS